jgi:pRiA4b ORF-3-like protein
VAEPPDANRIAALQHFDEQLSKLELAELQQLARSLQIFSKDEARAQILARHLVRAGRPDPRRPRRDTDVTYRVDVTMSDTAPPVWRRLDLSSALMLDDVHRILQAAFGFTDSHLHRFAVGPSIYDNTSALYLCEWDVEEGDDDGGVDEREVRLDELLVEPGDELLYAYDFGDSWRFTVKLAQVREREPDHPAAACVDGRRAGPHEDSGGPWHYDELVESGVIGKDFDRQATDEAVRHALDPVPGLPPLVTELLNSTEPSDVGDEIHALALRAELGEVPQVDADAAECVVARFRWLIERVGREGVQLTAAGYLPPALVEATMQELQLDPLWIGKANREDVTPPVARFRHAAQELGVVRRVKGRLTVPMKVHATANDPLKLWAHLVERLPLGREASAERFVAVLTLLWIAGGREPGSQAFYGFVAGALRAAGWRRRSGHPLDRDDAVVLAVPLLRVLDAAHCTAPYSGGRKPLQAAPHAVLFARTVLATRD